MAVRRTGLFGGTFNPIHFGHLQMAEVFYEQLQLEKLIFIPEGQPYHKALAGNATAQDRYNMVELAIVQNAGFAISDCELLRVGDTYTVDTLLTCRKQMGDEGEMWWLLGSDSLMNLHEWFRYEDILRLANIAVVLRAGFECKLLHPNIMNLLETGLKIRLDSPVNHGRIRFLNMLPYDISSSQIRSRIQSGQAVDDCLPPAVNEYIQQHQLYY